MKPYFKNAIKLLLLMCWMTTLVSCTTSCHGTLISHSEQGKNSADVRFRHCGYASGYSIAVYETKKGPPGKGQGSKEVFKTHYPRCKDPENNLQPTSPITVEWKSDNHLIVNHKTRIEWEDKEEHVVIKAQELYQGINIEYLPEPIVVE